MNGESRASRLEPTCNVYRCYSHSWQPCVMEMTQGTAISFVLVLSFQVGNSQIGHLCRLCNFVPAINRTKTGVPFILFMITFSFCVILCGELSLFTSAFFLLFFQKFMFIICVCYICVELHWNETQTSNTTEYTLLCKNFLPGTPPSCITKHCSSLVFLLFLQGLYL